MGLGETRWHMGREKEHPEFHWEWSCPKSSKDAGRGEGDSVIAWTRHQDKWVAENTKQVIGGISGVEGEGSKMEQWFEKYWVLSPAGAIGGLWGYSDVCQLCQRLMCSRSEGEELMARAGQGELHLSPDQAALQAPILASQWACC